jgi:tripartite-type tricarboxylate transporter receptor subunit TctC
MSAKKLRMSRRAMIAMMAGSGLVRFSPKAFAQSYPDRPVKFIVPFAPGGPTDIMARLVTAKLSENTGKQFYVENQGGAGGNIGMGAVARATPDGYTVLACACSLVILPSLYKKVPYDPVKDFASITIVGDTPSVFYVHPSVPAQTMNGLIDLIKANPGKYSYATGGIGTLAHLSTELLKLTYGLDFPHVPHRSAGPAIQSTIGGHVPAGVNSLPSAKELIEQGQLRGLGVTSPKRFPSAPDLPTMTEQGIPDQEDCNWQAYMLPAGTPRPIIDYLYREITRIVKEPEMRERFVQLGFTPIDNTPEDVDRRIKVDLEKWARVIRDANVEVQ